MKSINLSIDGELFVIVTKNGKTELGIKGKSTPESEVESHKINVPNILIVTRKNADVLFVLKGGQNDSFKIIIAQELYDKFRYQWFEPLADNYRELLYVNDAEYVKSAYRMFTWDDIAKFSMGNRSSYSFYKDMDGDWKQNPEGGAGYLLVLIEDMPYWTDAIGQIPFAVDTFRDKQNIQKTVMLGIEWGDGTFLGSKDYSNEYDNYFVLRGALFGSRSFTYKTVASGKTYPAVYIVETTHSVNPKSLGKPISKSELKQYGVWKK